MPKRSNDFQQLVVLFQQQLVQDGFTVTESKMVAGRTGRKREVDIAIEGKVGGHPVFFAVECRDHERVSDVKWIEELIGKYQHVPADKVIAVSRSGFSQDAVELARSNVAPRIETLSLTDAAETDWHAFFAQLRYVTTDFLIPIEHDAPPRVDVTLPPGAAEAAIAGVDLNRFRVMQPGHQHGPTLPELLNSVARSDEISRYIHDKLPPNTTGSVTLSVPFPEGTCLVGEGRSIPVVSLTFVMTFERQVRDIPLEHGTFAGAHVAYAMDDDYLGGKAQIAMLQGERNVSHLSIAFDEHVNPDSRLELLLHGENLEDTKLTMTRRSQSPELRTRQHS